MQSDVGVQNAKDGIVKNMLWTRSPISSVHASVQAFHPNIFDKDSISTHYNYTTPVGCYLILCVYTIIFYAIIVHT